MVIPIMSNEIHPNLHTQSTAAPKKPRWRRWLKEALLLLAFLIVASSIIDWWRAPKQALDAANAPLTLISGKQTSLAALSADKPLLVYFWGSWCGICRLTSPNISALAQDDYNVLSVALQSGDNPAVAKYQQQHNLHFATLNDDSGAYSAAWGVQATPTIIWVKNGVMRFHTTGFSSTWGLKWRTWLVSLWNT